MATYAELLTASSHEVLNNKIRVAVVIAAEVVRTENAATANHANRLIWARGVFVDPDREARRMVWAVLAQNAGATYAQIVGASDAAVQTAVNAAVDVFASGS
jgi:hypothetical protein